MTKVDWIALIVTLGVGGSLCTLIAYLGIKEDGHRGWHSRKNDQCDWCQSRGRRER